MAIIAIHKDNSSNLGFDINFRVYNYSMLIVGLTGGLAGGKPFVAGVFQKLGCSVVSADRLGHEVLGRDGEAFEGVIAAFGKKILGANGEIDRKRLGEIVFSSTAALKELSALVHPHVFKKQENLFAKIFERDPRAIIVSEAAIMIETGSYKRYDRIVVVSCPPLLQVRRYCEREGVTEAQARSRLNSQMSIEEKKKYADYIIDTAGTKQATKMQVYSIHKQLLLEVMR